MATIIRPLAIKDRFGANARAHPWIGLINSRDGGIVLDPQRTAEERSEGVRVRAAVKRRSPASLPASERRGGTRVFSQARGGPPLSYGENEEFVLD